MRKILTLLWIVIASLLAFGLIAVYTASTAQKGGVHRYFDMQLAAAALGTIVAIGLSRIDYHVWRNRSIVWILFVISIIACSCVFCFGAINGSHRWIKIAGISLQPSEFARIGVAVVMAAWFDRIGPKVRDSVRGFLIPAGLLVLMVAPVFLSPDVGATAVMVIVAGVIFIAAGVRWKWIFLGGVVLVVALALLVAVNPNKLSRVKAQWDSMRGIESVQETNFHKIQAREAFARGGWEGVGLGKSIQKHRYLPEANSDFIYAIVAEEFGIKGTLGLILAFSLFLLGGYLVAIHAQDRFGRFLALGLTYLISFEAFFNMGMVIGVLPTKGIALPFTSAGGTSLFATLLACGILLSIGVTTHAVRR